MCIRDRNMVFVNYTNDMIINTQFNTKYRPRVFYVLSLKSWKTSAVSTNVGMVETQLCKLRGTSDTFVRIIRFLWTKRTIWLSILSFTQNIVRACSMFYPHERYRGRWLPWMLPGSTGRFSVTNHSVHWYYITLIKGRYYFKRDINVRHGKQNPRRRWWLW